MKRTSWVVRRFGNIAVSVFFLFFFGCLLWLAVSLFHNSFDPDHSPKTRHRGGPGGPPSIVINGPWRRETHSSTALSHLFPCLFLLILSQPSCTCCCFVSNALQIPPLPLHHPVVARASFGFVAGCQFVGLVETNFGARLLCRCVCVWVCLPKDITALSQTWQRLSPRKRRLQIFKRCHHVFGGGGSCRRSPLFF